MTPNEMRNDRIILAVLGIVACFSAFCFGTAAPSLTCPVPHVYVVGKAGHGSINATIEGVLPR